MKKKKIKKWHHYETKSININNVTTTLKRVCVGIMDEGKNKKMPCLSKTIKIRIIITRTLITLWNQYWRKKKIEEVIQENNNKVQKILLKFRRRIKTNKLKKKKINKIKLHLRE